MSWPGYLAAFRSVERERRVQGACLLVFTGRDESDSTRETRVNPSRLGL
jgi:hypothetical protein